MNPIMEKLHDIEGVDPTGWWPLGVGWWVIIGMSFCLTLFVILYLLRRGAFRRSWKNDALIQLEDLETGVTEQTMQQSVILLSEYLRRIAVYRYSRSECAGLTGDAWLKWLTINDPKNYDWKVKGRPLIEAAYAPKFTSITVAEMQELIKAAKRWVR